VKIATWNVNGIRARQAQALEWLARERPDVVCLQELKATPEQIQAALWEAEGYWACWHGGRAYSGVALLVRRELAEQRPAFAHPDFDFEQRIVAAEVAGVTVASVYVPNGGKDFDAKVRFLEALEGWAAEFERRGHRTIVPTLPINEPEASALRYAEAIVQTLPDDAGDVVVVAHSASGLFLPLVPIRRQVRQIVFLAAVIPKIGASLIDQFRAEPHMMNPEWIGKDPTASEEIAMRFLFHDCSPEIAQWALTTRRLMYAQRAYTELCPLDRWPCVPSAYIVCADDRTVAPAWSKSAARERLGVEPIELSGGHCPHVSRPADLADALLAISL